MFDHQLRSWATGTFRSACSRRTCDSCSKNSSKPSLDEGGAKAVNAWSTSRAVQPSLRHRRTKRGIRRKAAITSGVGARDPELVEPAGCRVHRLAELVGFDGRDGELAGAIGPGLMKYMPSSSSSSRYLSPDCWRNTGTFLRTWSHVPVTCGAVAMDGLGRSLPDSARPQKSHGRSAWPPVTGCESRVVAPVMISASSSVSPRYSRAIRLVHENSLGETCVRQRRRRVREERLHHGVRVGRRGAADMPGFPPPAGSGGASRGRQRHGEQS